MNKKIKNIITSFEETINAIEVESTDTLQKAEKCIKVSKEALELLNQIITSNPFKDTKSEIHFFKQQKPKVFSRLIYYVKLFSIEGKRPRGSNKSQIKYLNGYIEKLQVYFNDNLEFYHYYRRGATLLDEQYFVRGKVDIRLYPDTFHFYIDKQFSTSHDATVATILAYDMLIIYLKKQIDNLNNNGMEMFSLSQQLNSKLFWTGNKTDLIELIYALHSSGAVNSGTADIKEMASACEQIFNIDLGNYYHTFVEIRSRKSNTTKFIDKLKESLIQRIDESDE
ncbi:RteC domain-containing protein [Tenacibaculum singaporense]|uniref:RteC domain-containing protein n=1 Tax=Tenacibaculum singaporense TaxID=2358479 RepID=UPI000F666EAF|nr:RteC domain-containing protein [Tenacibaculum singaporense]RSC93495.1 tetracycline regulation of excision, RteC [Tenacibaculum singaporense]